MHDAINEPSTHHYPPDRGTKEYRKAAADWMERRFGVAGLNPETEVVFSVRSKEAIHNRFLALNRETTP